MSTVKAQGPRSHWKALKHDPAGAVAVDTVTVINSKVTFAAADVAAGEVGAFVYEATDVEVPTAAVTITAGEDAYYDSGADNFTNVVGTNTLCGVFTEDAASGDAVGRIDLHL